MIPLRITTLAERDAVPLADRAAYYIDKRLLRAAWTFTRDHEPLIDVASAGLPVLLRPVWEDAPAHAADAVTQELIDCEAEELRAYVAAHPSFGILLRAGAVERLRVAASLLPAGHRLVLKIGYRPLAVQRRIVERLVSGFEARGLSHEAAYAEAVTYISDPATDVPPHATGGTVDLTVADAAGVELDMGSAVNDPDARSWLFADGLTDAQRANRRILLNAMLGAGFAPLASEWWHYSYGDPRWAVYYGEAQPLYGAIAE